MLRDLPHFDKEGRLKPPRDWSLPPPVAEAGRQNVGSCKERLRDYASGLEEGV